MKRHQMILLVILFGCGSLGHAAPECTDAGEMFNTNNLKYSHPIGYRYRTVAISDCGKVVRILSGEADKDGLFERTEQPVLSPDKKFAILNQIESGEVELSDGSLSYHEVAYCEIVALRSGCIIARETGEFCGGSFTQDGKWANPTYSNFSLIAETPRANKYASGTRKFTDSPGDTFDNLLACDPPEANNMNEYRGIIESRSLNLDDRQRKYFDTLH